MLKTLIASLTLMLLPAMAYADDASTLGPQSDSSASSNQTSSLLQPANPSSLQSADSAASGAAQSGSSASTLQQTSPTDAQKLLVQGDGEGQNDLNSGFNLTWLWYLLITLLAATAGTAAAIFIQGRKPTSVPAVAAPPEPQAAKPKKKRKSKSRRKS